MMSKHTSRALWGRGAVCLRGVGNPPPRNCWAWVQAVERCQNISPGHCGAGSRLFKWYWNLPLRHCGAGSRLLKRYWNLPLRHCGEGVQAVLAVSEPTTRAMLAGVQALQAVSEPTSQALWGRGTGSLTSVGTYLTGTVQQGCKLFKQCRNLPPGHCGAGC